jgi:hypothetical protein
MFRSRLEARWAAFFDQLGWTTEYEPFDLGVWSPDFLLHGHDAYGGVNVLVEVKPTDALNAEAAAKMARAGAGQAGGFPPMLQVGTAPKLGGHRQEQVFVGWYADRVVDGAARFYPAYIGWLVDADRPVFVPDLITHKGGWQHRGILYGDYGQPQNVYGPYPAHTMSLWAKATNAVQWRGAEAEPS